MNVQSSILFGKYRLRSYVYFGLVDEGVWFEAGRNSFLLPDRKLYPLVERFVAMIDAGHAIEAIMESVPPPVANLFGRLFESLREHEMLARLPEEIDFVATGQLGAAARSILDMLQDRLDGEALARAWRNWRSARLLLIGAGHPFRTAALNFSESAAGSIQAVILGDGRGEDEDWAERTLRDVVLRGPSEELFDDHHDLVIFAADALSLDETREWAQRLRPNANRAVMAIQSGQVGLIVPQDRGGNLRLDTALAQLMPAENLPDLGYAGLSMLGAVAGQLAIERFFGLGQDQADHAMVVDGRLEISRHALVPMPGLDNTRTGAFVTVPRHELPDARPLELYEQASLALDPWFDALFGPLCRVARPGLLQIPLMQQQIEVRLGSELALVNGWGLDLGAAGLRAMEEAIAVLARPLCPIGAAIAVTVDGTDWRPLALARLLDRAGLINVSEPAAIDPLAVEEAEIQLLARLLSYHGSSGATLKVASDAKQQAWSAQAVCHGQILSAGLGSSRHQAMVEALGQACSAAQWLASGLEPVQQSVPPARSALPLGSDLTVVYEPVDGLELPGGVACGYARFAGKEVAC